MVHVFSRMVRDRSWIKGVRPLEVWKRGASHFVDESCGFMTYREGKLYRSYFDCCNLNSPTPKEVKHHMLNWGVNKRYKNTP